MDLSKLISNKKILIEVVALVYNQVNLLLNFVQSLIMLGLKNFRMVTHFFKGKKIIKFLKFIYNNIYIYIYIFFFFRSEGSYDHPDCNVEKTVHSTVFIHG